MSGCTDTNKCECACHTNGMKFVMTSNPPKYCCECGLLFNSFNEDFHLSKRMNHLENCFVENNAAILKIQDTLNGLEASFELMKKALEFKESMKIPHKCPVCLGVQKLYLVSDEVVDCVACEAKGIIWG